jgi:hypothetical protein
MIAALSLGFATPVAAQPAAVPEYYFNVTVGGQPQSRTVEAIATTELFEDTAAFTADHEIGSGVFFDIAGAQRLTDNLVVGLAVSFFSSNGSAAGTASIPDPLFRDRPTIMPIELADLRRSEQFFHFQAIWFRPVGSKMDLAVSAGPSIARVSQEFASGALQEGTGTVQIGPDKQTGWGFGVNGGVDLTYLLTPRYGIGLLLRYTWASIGLPAADVTAGGFQAGAGLRVRF